MEFKIASGTVEFDVPFLVQPDGMGVTFDSVWAPEVTDSETDGFYISSDKWTAVSGYTGQYSYSGPVMHSSEYLGGRMLDDVIESVGAVFVICAVLDSDDWEAEPYGWVLLRHTSSTNEDGIF